MSRDLNSDETVVYGQRLAKRFGGEDAPFVATRSLKAGQIIASEVRVDQPNGDMSETLPPTDSYMLCMMLREHPSRLYFEEGRQVSKDHLRIGDVIIHNLLSEPAAVMDVPIHMLLMQIPNSAFRELAEQEDVPVIGELIYKRGQPILDESIQHIGCSLLSALKTPDRTNRLFTDHIMLALAAHTAQAYGGMKAISRPLRGGLAPWQEKRSKEMLAGDLTGATPLREIAEACGLSISHFSRAFHKSTGLAPHAWLLGTRVEAAKAFLRRGDASLSAVALLCGFADQSHFATVFRRRVGLSPSAWRRSVLS
jgi:AraC family transcriptional regulator